MDENLRQRTPSKLLRVTFPNGKVICHKNVTKTFIDTLVEIGSSRFEEITLESCHLPLLSREIYPRLKDWMKPVTDGWYLNTQSDTGQKYMQLRSIKEQLGLDIEIEIGTGFITSDEKAFQKTKKAVDKLLVKFPDGTYIAGDSVLDTYLEAIWKIGPDEIKRKDLEFMGKPIITLSQMMNNQVQVGVNRWLYVPSATKDKCRLLRYISTLMKLNLEVNII